MKRFFPVCSFVVFVACHAQPEDSDTPSIDAAQPESAATPAGHDALADALRARHADDLPTAEQLGKYPDAEDSLRELARTADTMLVRTRALALLRHFDSEPTGELLIGYVQDPELHPALRAAAVTGLGGQRLEAKPEWLTIVSGALRDADPRVALAAVEVLGVSPAGREQLQRAVDDAAVSEQVRAAIESRE